MTQLPITFLPVGVLYTIDVTKCFQDIVRGESYLKLRPDRVAMQDATAQVCTPTLFLLTCVTRFSDFYNDILTVFT